MEPIRITPAPGNEAIAAVAAVMTAYASLLAKLPYPHEEECKNDIFERVETFNKKLIGQLDICLSPNWLCSGSLDGESFHKEPCCIEVSTVFVLRTLAQIMESLGRLLDRTTKDDAQLQLADFHIQNAIAILQNLAGMWK